MDFETLLREDPDHVIEYLANRGTKLLGAFITEARKVQHLVSLCVPQITQACALCLAGCKDSTRGQPATLLESASDRHAASGALLQPADQPSLPNCATSYTLYPTPYTGH